MTTLLLRPVFHRVIGDLIIKVILNCLHAEFCPTLQKDIVKQVMVNVSETLIEQ